MYYNSASVCTCFNERWEKEERKKQARTNKQQGKATQTHPRQSIIMTFSWSMTAPCLGIMWLYISITKPPAAHMQWTDTHTHQQREIFSYSSFLIHSLMCDIIHIFIFMLVCVCIINYFAATRVSCVSDANVQSHEWTDKEGAVPYSLADGFNFTHLCYNYSIYTHLYFMFVYMSVFVYVRVSRVIVAIMFTIQSHPLPREWRDFHYVILKSDYNC